MFFNRPLGMSVCMKVSSKSARRRVRSVFISDVHLGTRDCQAEALCEFLSAHQFERLYLVGDIFDGWRMRNRVYWTPAFNKLIRRVLKLSKKGVDIVYITGNHDEFLRRFAGNRFERIKLCNRTDHMTADGRRLLIMHGDQFENRTRISAWLKWVGDHGYEWLMTINRVCNVLRRVTGRGRFSLAGYLKQHVARAREHHEQYEFAAIRAAFHGGFDSVVCGHIHPPAIKRLAGVSYYNTGDWVENRSAFIEHHSGQIELVIWAEYNAPQLLPQPA